MKNEKYHTVETAPKSNRKIIERDPPKKPKLRAVFKIYVYDILFIFMIIMLFFFNFK